MSNAIFKLSSAGGVTSETRYPNMLTNYGDFGALTRIAYVNVTNTTTQNIYLSNIPQTYQDLILVINARSAYTGASTAFAYTYINNDSGTLYSQTRLVGTGSSAISDRTSNAGICYLGEIPSATTTTGIFGSSINHILNYANTSTFKTILTRSACDLNGSGFTHLWAQTYRSTNGVSILSCYNTNANYWAQGTTFELFGVKASAA